MGRQTAVAMTDADEKEFVTFLHSISDIQIFKNFASSKEDVWVDDFEPREQGHWQYFIWNKAFPWKFEYNQVSLNATVAERRGWFYIQNTSTAPVIEYDRHNFADKHLNSCGRVYWAKSRTDDQPKEHYDFNSFGKWYNQIVRWIRKNGKQRVYSAYNPYYLPNALELDRRLR